MEHLIISYAPLVLVVVYFFTEKRVFATPLQLEELHTKIIAEIKEEYATKEIVEEIKENIKDIKDEIKIISNYILNNHQ